MERKEVDLVNFPKINELLSVIANDYVRYDYFDVSPPPKTGEVQLSIIKYSRINKKMNNLKFLYISFL